MAKRLMHIEGNAHAAGPPTPIRARVARHLARRGFTSQPAQHASRAMVFKRGSAFGSSTSFSPAKWETTLTITLGSADDWKTAFEVNTTGQTVTDTEREFWAAESAALVAVIEGREPLPMSEVEKQTAGRVPRMFGLALGYGLLYGFIGASAALLLRTQGVQDRYLGTIPTVSIAAGIRVGLRKANGMEP